MGRLILVRHGQTDMNKEHKYYGRLDVPVNEIGKEQAKKACNNLEAFNIDYDKIYSSNLKRAYETAEIINYKKYDICIDERLQEMDFGIFEGLSYDEIMEKYPEEMGKLKDDWRTYSYVIGENPYEMQERAIEFLNSIDKTKNILVATHWGIICSLLSYLFSNKLESYWKFDVKNGGIVVIEFTEDNFPILSYFNIGG